MTPWLTAGLDRLLHALSLPEQGRARTLFRNAAYTTLGHVVTTLKGVVTGYFLTYVLLPETYGAYRFVLSAVGMLSFLNLQGLPSTLATEVSRQGRDAPVRGLLRIQMLAAACGSVGLLLAIPLLSWWGRQDLAPAFFVVAVVSWVSTCTSALYSGLLRGREDFQRNVTLSLQTSVSLVIFVPLVLLTWPTPWLLLLVVLGVPSVVYARELWRLRRSYPSRASAAPLVPRLLQLSLTTVPQTIAWHIDGLLVAATFGLKESALYYVVSLIPEQMKIWMKEVFPVAYAYQSQGDDSAERRSAVLRWSLYGTLLLLVAVVAYILLIPFVAPYVFPQYAHHPSFYLLTSLSALTLLAGPATLNLQFLEARAHLHALQACQWTSALVYIGCMIWLIPAYGVLGAVISRGLFRLTLALSGIVAVRLLPLRAA